MLAVERLASSRVITSVGALSRSPVGRPLEPEKIDGAAGDGTRGHLELAQAHGFPRISHIRRGQRQRNLAGRGSGTSARRSAVGPEVAPRMLKSSRDSPRPVQRTKPKPGSRRWRSSTRAEEARKSGAHGSIPQVAPRVPAGWPKADAMGRVDRVKGKRRCRARFRTTRASRKRKPARRLRCRPRLAWVEPGRSYPRLRPGNGSGSD